MAALPAEIEWLDPEPVADQPEPPLLAVEKGDCEHPDQSGQGRLDTVPGAELQHHFAIGTTAEGMA